MSKVDKKAILYALLVGVAWLLKGFEAAVLWLLCMNTYETMKAGEYDGEE